MARQENTAPLLLLLLVTKNLEPDVTYKIFI